jgi:UDP:flavonoid glycosyltransferase YjiC (YdhE family)
LNENFVRANIEAYRQLMLELEPEIVVDFWNPFACAAARALNKPLVAVMQADQHPANKGFIWWREPPDDLPTCLPAFNRVIAEYGLDPVPKVEALNLGDLTLIVGTPALDPIPEGAEGAHIGPVLWEKKGDNLPAWVEEIDRDRPLVWVYSGNPKYGPVEMVIDSGIIIEAAAQVLPQLDVNVILTSGTHKLPQKYLPLPDTFHYAPFLPGLQLARRCDLMIHHGGYGSCQTGLVTGTPAVIIPTFTERESNARRVAAVGAGEFVLPGVTGRKNTLDPDEFREKVERVLSEPSYLANAQVQSETMAGYRGPDQAVELIEAFAGGRTKNRR